MLAPSLRWTAQDLEVLSDYDRDGWLRHEVIEGELYVTRAPHLFHQESAGNLEFELKWWSRQTKFGKAFQAPGVIFSPFDAVIPDLVWVSHDRLQNGLDEAGHLIVPPNLIVEILSPGEQNEKRDRDIKLKLYARYQVDEYWIVNWQLKTIEIYRHDRVQLQPIETLAIGDTLKSPLLPDFECPIDRIFDA